MIYPPFDVFEDEHNPFAMIPERFVVEPDPIALEREIEVAWGRWRELTFDPDLYASWDEYRASDDWAYNNLFY